MQSNFHVQMQRFRTVQENMRIFNVVALTIIADYSGHNSPEPFVDMRTLLLSRSAASIPLTTTSLFYLAALQDASSTTTVGVSANAYDKRTSGSGCSPSGCKASLVRDGSLSAASRWSCNYDLEDEDCKICFTFKKPQDIVKIKVRLSFN